MRQVSDLKNSVAGLLSGTNLNNVTNLDVALGRAVRVMAQRVDIPEASGRHNFMLYSGVYDYLAPDTIFGGAVNDLRPQGIVREPWDYNYKQPIALFDRTKAWLPNGYKLTFEYDKGVGIMRVATPNVTQNVLLDPMNATTDWVAAGTATTLTQDTSVFYQQPASLRFDLTVGTGTLTKTLPNAINISTYEGVGVAFLAIMIPEGTDPTTITGIELKIGSSSLNYDAVSATEGFLGAWIAGDFLLVAFDMSTATPTGTPDWTAIDYLQVSVTTTGSVINFRVGYLFISLPAAHTLLFQSAAIFLASGVLSNIIVNDNDQITLNDAAFSLLEYESAKTIAMQMSGGIYTEQIKGFDQVLNGSGSNPGLYAQYEADNPSNELRTVGNYYTDD